MHHINVTYQIGGFYGGQPKHIAHVKPLCIAFKFDRKTLDDPDATKATSCVGYRTGTEDASGRGLL